MTVSVFIPDYSRKYLYETLFMQSESEHFPVFIKNKCAKDIPLRIYFFVKRSGYFTVTVIFLLTPFCAMT